jgi:hypothetical protein
MTPTLLEVTLAVVVAVLAFMWAVQVLPLLWAHIVAFFNDTLGDQAKDQKNDNIQSKDDDVSNSW